MEKTLFLSAILILVLSVEYGKRADGFGFNPVKHITGGSEDLGGSIHSWLDEIMKNANESEVHANYSSSYDHTEINKDGNQTEVVKDEHYEDQGEFNTPGNEKETPDESNE